MYTEIAYILDRSGSMTGLTQDAISGFNHFLKDQLAAPGHANLSLILFDNEYLLPHDRQPLQLIPQLTTATYQPRGSTALLDAIARTIDELGAKLATLPEPERPAHVIIAIYTDGEENASCHYTLRDVEQRITHQSAKYGWEFLFLAANQDAIATASAMGIDTAGVATTEASKDGLQRTNKALSASILKSRKMVQETGHYNRTAKQTLSEEYREATPE